MHGTYPQSPTGYRILIITHLEIGSRLKIKVCVFIAAARLVYSLLVIRISRCSFDSPYSQRDGESKVSGSNPR